MTRRASTDGNVADYATMRSTLRALDARRSLDVASLEPIRDADSNR